MARRSKSIVIVLLGGVVIFLCIFAALVAPNGRTVFPLRVSVRKHLVGVPESDPWIAVWKQPLPPAEFDKFVKAHPSDREFAFALFANDGMTNYVRILTTNDPETAKVAIRSLNANRMANGALVVEAVLNEAR